MTDSIPTAVFCKLVVSLQMQNRKATDKINQQCSSKPLMLPESSTFAFCNCQPTCKNPVSTDGQCMTECNMQCSECTLIMPAGSGLSVTPSADQFLAVSSPLSVTFTCNASQDELNSVGTIVMWEVDGMRFDTTATPFVGVFVEEVALGVLNLTVTGAAGVQFEDSGLRLACLSMTTSFSPAMSSLAPLYVRFFGKLHTLISRNSISNTHGGFG